MIFYLLTRKKPFFYQKSKFLVSNLFLRFIKILKFISVKNPTCVSTFLKILRNIADHPVDKSVDKSAISVDKSAKPVDNFSRAKKLSTGKPTYPHFIHRLIHRKNRLNRLIIKNKKKLSTENGLPNNNNLLILKEVIVGGSRTRTPAQLIFYDPWLY